MRPSSPGVTTARARRASAATVLERRGAQSNFLGYHGYPGGDLRLAQRRGRARHPRRPASSHEGDISPSTAARSSTAGTATPRSPSASARSTPRRSASSTWPSGSLAAGIAAMVDGQPARRHRRAPSRRWSTRPGTRSSGATPATASAGPCTSSPTVPNHGPGRHGRPTAGRQRAGDRADGRAPARADTVVLADGWTWSPPTARVVPRRAHRRRHRRRPRGPDPGLTAVPRVLFAFRWTGELFDELPWPPCSEAVFVTLA